MTFRDPYEPPSTDSVLAPTARPLAWEAPGQGFLVRLFGTMRAAFSPLSTSLAATTGELGPPLRFALLAALPWTFLTGILPFTRTLLFKPGFAVEVLDHADRGAIALDVARASLIGSALMLLAWGAWVTPFASLARAFASERVEQAKARTAALRLALYVSWIVPCGVCLLYFATWAAPGSVAELLTQVLLLVLGLLPRLLIVAHCHALARCLGAGNLGALAVAFVPLVVELTATQLLGTWAAQLLPPDPTAESET